MDEETKEEVETTETPPKPETDWKAQARKWETRAKENARAAQELEKLKASQMTETEKLKADLAAATEKANALQAEKDRREWAASVSKETGVPASILVHINAANVDELTEIAKEIAGEIHPGVVVKTDGMQPKEPPATARDSFKQTMELFG